MLADARAEAAETRKLIVDGIDPVDQRRQVQAAAQEVEATTFAEAVNSYIADHEASWRNPKHLYQWRATLDHACVTLGAKAVSAIDTDDVLGVLRPLWTAKPETASRLRGRIEMALSYAAVSGLRDRNVLNPATWWGHLQLMLQPSPGRKQPPSCGQCGSVRRHSDGGQVRRSVWCTPEGNRP